MDWGILYWIQDNLRCDFLDTVMPLYTQLGEAGAIWILIALVLIITKKNRRLGLMLLLGLLASLIIGNIILKPLIMRPRPCWLDPSVSLLVKQPWDYSFPSGHTYASVLSAVLIWKENRTWGIVAAVAAAIMAFSRMYLFVHFPSDVLAGVVIGLAIGFGTCYAFNIIIKRKVRQ